MLKVKIESITGFGKTAEFATIQLMHYSLANKSASASVNLFEEDPFPAIPVTVAVPFIMSNLVNCTAEDISAWGTDDMVFVDAVLAKIGITRDADWVQPQPEIVEIPSTPPADELP